ncbi:hypothetical protein SPRG_06434 [Saprolegnia parasitica CBS 223.65]|uniref:Uncharacterized protein n=1 Tax=Saprolegnia parasitica (strain CBS 223.65) TaxID=695850 RepID=A0A067CDK2_SAPPC|nr:hypothetical protein SPRG_06434 [Saprolegnia parasitica CBS 223.65]KDO28578.1 hypothetical protein SPRG_06434 [Saprolegnia parasitica CBS 223.65]|eukprot:XP_012200641.1 hypothetical protein SPRG_06434 [Saprolegnia parasitica CBS 223.65]
MTFCSSVLGQPEIAAIVFGYQDGLYEDVRRAFYANRELVEFNLHYRIYEADASFATTLAPHADWDHYPKAIFPSHYLVRSDVHDERFSLHAAVDAGCTRLTQRILHCRPRLASEDAIVLALQRGRLEVAALLLDMRVTMPGLYRRVHFVRLVRDATRRFPGTFLASVLAREDTTALALLHRFGVHLDDFAAHHGYFSVSTARERILQHAISKATLENMTLALELFPWFIYTGVLDDVASRDFLPLVRSLHERGLECSTAAMDLAAANGHLDVVMFLHVQRTEGCTVEALDGAIRSGHLDVVRFLLEHRTEGASPNILDEAAANGHVDVVQYLHTRGSFRCTVTAVDKAAAGGHLDVVRFLMATGRSRSCRRGDAVHNALQGGHLATAEYLLSLGCPFPKSVISLAVKSLCEPKIVDVCRLLEAHGQPRNVQWMKLACAANNVALVEFLHEPSGDSYGLETAIQKCAWDVVRFLLANGAAGVSVEASNVSQSSETTTFFKALPRECLLECAGHPKHVTASKLLLPYCLDATKHLDNIVLLLDLLTLPNQMYPWPNRRRMTILALITPELLDQGRKTSQTIRLPPNVAARASTLLQSGEVVDWAQALVIGHLWATDSTVTAKQLLIKTALVQDDELKAQLTRLLASKRTRKRKAN